MQLQEFRTLYLSQTDSSGSLSQLSSILLRSGRPSHFLLSGISGSAIALELSSIAERRVPAILVAMSSEEAAAYMSSDLARLLDRESEIQQSATVPTDNKQQKEKQVLFFPCSERRRQKAKDEAYEIQRTEVLTRLSDSLSSSQAGERRVEASSLQGLPPQARERRVEASSLQELAPIANRRTRTSEASCGSLPPIIVSYAEALSEPVVMRQTLTQAAIELRGGQTLEISALSSELSAAGFTRVDFVYEPGQYAVRGGIVDIFSYNSEMPYRLDFFGNEIDTIRLFDIETQLSEQKVEVATIIPELSSDSEHVATLASYLPEGTIVVSDDFSLLRFNLESSLHKTYEYWQPLFSGEYHTIEVSRHSFFDSYESLNYDVMPQPVFHKNFDLFADTLKQLKDDGYSIYISSDAVKQTDRIEAILDSKDLPHIFTPVKDTLHEGFVDRGRKIAFLTDHQLFERYHKARQAVAAVRRSKALITLKELNQLRVGDYVVHVDHGIGRFGGLVRSSINGKPQEMIKIVYRDQDSIFVSIHNLHRISKYKGKEGTEPHISKLGSGQWERMKERTKQKVKDIARDLIRLYAQRHSEQGFQYSPDSYLQHELEASFLYEDTPDQQKATIDVKHDMESPAPMDRLVCGDVGFGKTEVAMRAAFKAATDGKQVAVLVPTTVLALQHYNTFCERFKRFPVRVDYLSRAKNAKQTKEILKDLEDGKIDIIIGTHKLVGKSVRFKDLGLLIIDEEQKFGVAVKEKLRQMRVNIDTLTLTATPIPRTLQFSLLGARDLSIINTPPPNRYPVQTEVISTDDDDIIKEAIELEMNRNGQIFVVNNVIQTLPNIENRLHKLCPTARIAIAHGQMAPELVEQILTDFINYDYDILLSTSIIESGVDMPNVNTIIINSAHRFGLSDLHQLRGRVGRSNRKAYCYLVAPANELLTPEARRRLQAVETFAELGSGFHIAMQDLDIRGAGNMLGAEQSGFIAELGYETYQRILNEAMLELREEEGADGFDEHSDTDSRHKNEAWVTDSQLETDLEISFPSEYIENVSERITLYRELDSLQTEQQLQDYAKRLVDRFGAMPQQALELLDVVRLRWQCIRLGIEKIYLKAGNMSLFFPSNTMSPYYQSDAFSNVIQYVVHNPRRCRFHEQGERKSVHVSDIKSVSEARSLLSQIEKWS